MLSGACHPAPVTARLPSSIESLPLPETPKPLVLVPLVLVPLVLVLVLLVLVVEFGSLDDAARLSGKEGMLELSHVKRDSSMRRVTTLSARSASWLPKQQCVMPT